MQHAVKKRRKKNNRGFHDETQLISVLRQLLRIQRNPWEVFKRNRKFLCELQVLWDEHVLGGLSQPDSHFLFSFCRDLALLAVKSPKEDTAQARRHCPVWFWALGKSWSQERLSPSPAHCPSTVTASPRILLQSHKPFQRWGRITSWCPCFSLCLVLDSSITF